MRGSRDFLRFVCPRTELSVAISLNEHLWPGSSCKSLSALMARARARRRPPGRVGNRRSERANKRNLGP